tara:strand:+ start:670 stop:1251 length:582 start_codon:yes stop_codon:yes gene_type:complete
MAYNLKNVFYLDTSATITKGTAGGGSAQLDLSAYIDPIARGRQKGTGLAVYKTHYSVTNSEDSNEVATKSTDEGIMAVSLQAGLGAGDNVTGGLNIPVGATDFEASNQLLVSAGNFYSPNSATTAAPTSFVQQYVEPSKDVPYVIVRDNVCMVYCVSDEKQFTSTSILSVRLECAIIPLDQATLNQLLRTQTV